MMGGVKIALLLVAAGFGYWIFLKACQETGMRKVIGLIIAWFIMVVSIITVKGIILVRLLNCQQLCRMEGPRCSMMMKGHHKMHGMEQDDWDEDIGCPMMKGTMKHKMGKPESPAQPPLPEKTK